MQITETHLNSRRSHADLAEHQLMVPRPNGDGCPVCQREHDPFGTGDNGYYEYAIVSYPESCYYDGHADPANPD
jgi:hypothetical protein